MNLLSLINLSLAYVYYSTTLSNYGLIRFNRLVLVDSSRELISIYATNFIIILYLIVLIGSLFSLCVFCFTAPVVFIVFFLENICSCFQDWVRPYCSR
jgi:hypothetical protein